MLEFKNMDGKSVWVNPARVIMVDSADTLKNNCTRLHLATGAVVVWGSEVDTVTALRLALEVA
jgi:hypothetical protein